MVLRGGVVGLIAGRYTLDREIGRGGMGAVWLGRDETLNRVVALKRLGLVPGTHRADRERADREARLAARLSDPHIVAVFDLVLEGTEQWLVMEYVDGRNLAELVRATGPLTPEQAAPLLAQAAGGLAAAHAAGIVHRDVKPSNILVTSDSDVKITDFGIARTDTDVSLTQTGLVTGSPAYLAPEVASGRPATTASDVWSWGATLFHTLTGQPPYDVGENLLGALYRIVHEDPPRTERAGWLAPVLEGTMTHDPADRWTMTQVRDHLAAGPATGNVRTLAARSGGRATAAAGGAGAVSRAVGAPAPLPESRVPPAPAQASDAARDAAGGVAGGPRSPRALWAALAVALLVLVLAGGAYLVGGLGGSDAGTAHGRVVGTGPRTTRTSSPPTRTPTTPTSEQLTSFVTAYLARADADPRRTFGDLTTRFQASSGGLTGYLGFWHDVDVKNVIDVSADPKTLVVGYTYTWQKGRDRPVTQPVRLQLVRSGDGFLIDGEF